MINIRSVRRFCAGRPEEIENYMAAFMDNEHTWDIHHRKEDEGYSKSKLIELGMYYKRPASELLFLMRREHRRLHKLLGEKNPMLGRHHSDETREKISSTRLARINEGIIKVDTSGCHTYESNKKISEKAKERLKDKTRHPMYGKTWKWYNDGTRSYMLKEGDPVPENLKPGLLRKKK